VSNASTTDDLPGLLDLVIDPVTLDFVDAPDGGLLETTDSRTAVLFQLRSLFNGWWGDPAQGSRLRALLRGGADPVELLDIVDECKRCLQPLIAQKIIAELDVSTDVDENQRPVILLNYRDLSSGGLIDISFVPLDL
jgi:phage gp46-like protein